MMYQAGLVLEGGGMKGVYTSGVLDYFMEQNLEFSSCYGVSAGASNLCSFISKQKTRAYHIMVDYLDDKDYCSKRSLIKTGDMFNVEMCYDLIPNVLNPFDYETFQKYTGKAYAVVTNIETGKAEYMQLKDMKQDTIAVRASCSLPLISRNVIIHGKPYLDGGISDSIPLQRSMLDGNLKNVVILTKEEGYIRQPSKHLELLRLRYLKYPKVYELMKNRHLMYNETLKLIDSQVQNQNAFVIRPKHKSPVNRIEHERYRLEKLYEEGYEDAKNCFPELLQFLDTTKNEKGAHDFMQE